MDSKLLALKKQLVDATACDVNSLDFRDIDELDLAILQDHIDGLHSDGKKWTVSEILDVYYEGDPFVEFFRWG